MSFSCHSLQVLALCDIHPLKQRLTGRNGADWGDDRGEGGRINIVPETEFPRFLKLGPGPRHPFHSAWARRCPWSVQVVLVGSRARAGRVSSRVFFIFVAAVDDGYVYGLKYRVTVLLFIYRHTLIRWRTVDVFWGGCGVRNLASLRSDRWSASQHWKTKSL